MNKVLEIGYPMEYEDDKNIIRTGLWLKEYEVELLEKTLKELKQLKKEKSSLMTALNTSREKYNNDKARYRRKYKDLKKQKDDVVKYIKEAMYSDSFTELPSGEITDIGYCIPAFEDILRMLGEIDNE